MSEISLINVSIAKQFENKVVYERTSAGMFSLIAALEHAGIEVYFNEHFLDHHCSLAEEIERFSVLIDPSAPVIGIGCHSIHLPFVVKISQAMRQRFPEKVIVLGGIGPSSVARDLLEAFDFIDAVVVGEGEQTLVEVVQKGKSAFQEIRGLVYRNNGTVECNSQRPAIEHLDMLPLPAYHAVNFSHYQIPTIITSRGCPHECPFCSLCTFWGKLVCYRSVENVIEELKLLKEQYDVKYVFFGDPTLNLDRERVLTLCRRLQEEHLDIGWECLVRADGMDEELMAAMCQSGCEAVFYGLESGSERVHAKIKGNSTVQGVVDVIKQSSTYFKTVEVGLMWGFPFETLEDFKETVNIRHYLEHDLHCEVQLRWLEPYPSTQLFKQYSDTLFMPERESIAYNKKMIEQEIVAGREFYPHDRSVAGIKITSDVTNVRFIIAASHTVSLCQDIIELYPHIFSDHYRYRTPQLDKKISIAQKISIY